MLAGIMKLFNLEQKKLRKKFVKLKQLCGNTEAASESFHGHVKKIKISEIFHHEFYCNKLFGQFLERFMK